MTLARFSMCIGGEWVDALSGKTFESLNPALAQPWAELPDADEADVERAVQAAQSAFDSPAWRGLTATARGKLLRRLGDLIAENKEQLAQLESRDNGKLIRETRGQVGYLPEFFHYTAGLADKLEGGTLPLDKPDLFAYTVHEAMGVVAAIIPWNSPLYLTAIKLAPALAAGNTIVIKPSEHASATILELARLALEAGIPPGVVNVVTGYGPSTGAALTRHPLVRKIAFTGGAATARHVVRSSAENFAKLSLELGGKSPNIIFADADLDSAINGAIAGIYAASGQSCVSGSRLLVQDEIYDEFVSRLVERAQRIRIGNPQEDASEMGPMATAQQLAVVEGLVADAIAEGARLRTGGKRPEDLGDGWFYEPTLFECDRNSMKIMAGRSLRPGRLGDSFQGRSRSPGDRQRLAIRPRRRHLDPRPGPCPSPGPGCALGHHLGQHLPCSVGHGAHRWFQEQWLWTRERHRFGAGLYRTENGVDQPVPGAYA